MQVLAIFNTVKKILLSFLPPLYWFFIAIGILYPEGTFYSAIFHWILFTAFLKISLFIHEYGHLLMGKLAGGTPKRMSIGTGHTLLKAKIWGVKTILCDKLTAGYAYVDFSNRKPEVWNKTLFTLGGIIFNSLVVVLCLIALPKTTDLQTLYFDNNILLSLIASNGYIIVLNLFPRQITLLGVNRPNDGLITYQILSGKNDFSFQHKRSTIIIELIDFMEDGNYEEATRLARNYLEIDPQDDLIRAYFLICFIKSGDMAQAQELSSALREDIRCESNDEKAIIYNILAHYAMIEGDIDHASDLARVAFSFNEQIRHIRLTKGALLIEREIYKEGVAIIEPYIDIHFKDNFNLEGAIYLALAYQHLANKKKASRYFKYLERNIESMEADIRMLYDRHKTVLSGIKTMQDYGQILKTRDKKTNN